MSVCQRAHCEGSFMGALLRHFCQMLLQEVLGATTRHSQMHVYVNPSYILQFATALTYPLTGLPASYGCSTRVQVITRQQRRAAAAADAAGSGAAPGDSAGSAALGSPGARPLLDNAATVLSGELARGRSKALGLLQRPGGTAGGAAGDGGGGAQGQVAQPLAG